MTEKIVLIVIDVIGAFSAAGFLHLIKSNKKREK